MQKNRQRLFTKAPKKFLYKKSTILSNDHFVREGIDRQTVYNALNPRKNGQSIFGDTHLCPPSSWTSFIKKNPRPRSDFQLIRVCL
jgi:hypothetical protein